MWLVTSHGQWPGAIRFNPEAARSRKQPAIGVKPHSPDSETNPGSIGTATFVPSHTYRCGRSRIVAAILSLCQAAARFSGCRGFRRSSTEAKFINALDEHTGHSWLASVTQSQSRQSTAWTNGIADVFIRVDMAGLFQICCIRTRGWIPLPPMGEDSPMRVKICLPFVKWSANCLWTLRQACGAIRVRMRLFGRRPILRIPDLLTRSAPRSRNPASGSVQGSKTRTRVDRNHSVPESRPFHRLRQPQGLLPFGEISSGCNSCNHPFVLSPSAGENAGTAKARFNSDQNMILLNYPAVPLRMNVWLQRTSCCRHDSAWCKVVADSSAQLHRSEHPDGKRKL